MDKDQNMFFCYRPTENLPIFIEICGTDFPVQGLQVMKNIGFEEVKEGPIIKDISDKDGRLLKIEQASFNVSKKIDSVQELDQYGPENLTPGEGYQVYRYRGMAMMIYSINHPVWSMGYHKRMLADESSVAAFKIILSRFLAWSLAPLGVVGFWGVPVEEGVVIQKQKESLGEAVFFHLEKKKLYSQDGMRDWSADQKFYQLTCSLEQSEKLLSFEQLFTLLSLQCLYFDYRGPSLEVKRRIQRLSVQNQAVFLSSENFQPRQELNS